ncbi:vWA domain-containing protein [Halomonas sp. NO4]|uniref:vWA domain-containing protein n=1 Tax=Halomonas sp. NO4 TaxID=2484813 RepID=UPI0013D39985|nr:vWA domain-containing protein [Halomonas sp. NO4]
MGRAWRSGTRWLTGLLGALLLWGALPAVAQEPPPDVRVIVDVSGSMRDNDPEQLAAEALELLVTLLPGGTRSGVWTFGESVANPLPPGTVDADWRAQAMDLAPRLEGRDPFTDIEAAIREAAANESPGERHLVLLTDGMIDLPPWRGAKPQIDTASRRQLLETLAPRLAESEVVVHAIAFSDEADLALVERLAQQTGGLSAPVESPDALLGAFLRIVDRIFPNDRAPLRDGGFVIEPGLEGFNALLFREPGAPPTALVGPDGRRYTAESPPEGARWRREQRYDLIQVPEPMAGQWRLEGEVGEQSRVTLVSPLTLQTAPLPGTLYLGFPVPVEAWLSRDGESLPPAEWPAHLQVSAELRDDAGETQAATALAPRQDRFVGELPAPVLAGTAQLAVRAEGQGLRRQRVQAVNVLPAVTAEHDTQGRRVLLRAEHPALYRDNTELHGQLQGQRLEAAALGDQRWAINLPVLDENLTQPLMLRGRVTLEGRTRELRLPRLLLFPEGATGIDIAQAQPSLAVERFHEAPAPSQSTPTEVAPEGVARFIALLDRLPRLARGQWETWQPVMARWFEAHGRDPRLWAGVAVLVCGLMLLLVWRRRRRRLRVRYREEPHV